MMSYKITMFNQGSGDDKQYTNTGTALSFLSRPGRYNYICMHMISIGSDKNNASHHYFSSLYLFTALTFKVACVGTYKLLASLLVDLTEIGAGAASTFSVMTSSLTLRMATLLLILVYLGLRSLMLLLYADVILTLRAYLSRPLHLELILWVLILHPDGHCRPETPAGLDGQFRDFPQNRR